jgi:hypothetical protein
VSTRRRITFSAIRDGVSFAGAWVIILVQLFGPPSRVNWMLLVVALIMSGVPAAVAAGKIVLGRGSDATDGSSSPSPPSPPS